MLRSTYSRYYLAAGSWRLESNLEQTTEARLVEKPISVYDTRPTMRNVRILTPTADPLGQPSDSRRNFIMFTFLLLVFLAGDGPILYGSGVKDNTPMITIDQLLDNPESYLDKVVKLKGTVAEVCPMAGCWMDLQDKENKLRIKVKDGEIVFDQALEGKAVLAEGTVYKIDLSKEQAVKYYQHQAEEKGKDFDPASITKGTTLYQIGGIGARVL